MKVIILYSKHDKSEKQAKDIQFRLGAQAKAKMIEVFDDAEGQAIKKLLEPRDFPCVVVIHDHLQGPELELGFVEAAVAQQRDIDEKQYHRRDTSFLESVLKPGRDAD